MEECYPKRSRTLTEIKMMEESVLLKLIDRSKWRSFPSGPRQCYEKGGITDRVITLKIVDNTFYERLQLILAFRNHHHNNNYNGGGGARGILGGNGGNHLPRMIGPRPMWRMTKDIAIMDKLQTIELYRCTGKLPRSMNYLTKLTRLRLDGCRDIDLSLLGTGYGSDYGRDCTSTNLRDLMELKITDCEGLTPRKFQHLPQIQRLTLMRWDKSNNQTMELGKQWVQELSSAVVFGSIMIPLIASTTSSAAATSSANATTNNNNNDNNNDDDDDASGQPLPLPLPQGLKFRFRWSLQHLTFSGSRLTNTDLGNILFKMVHKFPALDSLVVSDNPEINSFKEVCDVATTMTETMGMRERVVSRRCDKFTTTDYSIDNNYSYFVDVRMTSNLKTLKLSDTNIKVNNTELDSVIHFLEKLHPTIGTMKVFSYDSDSTNNHQSSSGGDGNNISSSNTNTRYYSGDGPGNYFRRMRRQNASAHRTMTSSDNGSFRFQMDDDKKPPSLRRKILLPFDQASRIHKIEYLLSMNATKAFSMTGTCSTTTTTAEYNVIDAPAAAYAKSSREVGGIQIVNAARITREKEAANRAAAAAAASSNTTTTYHSGAVAAATLASVSLSTSSSSSVGNDQYHHRQPPQRQISTPVSISKPVPLSVWPLALSKAMTRRSYRTCNQDSDIRDEDNFRHDTRYDVVYHMLRHGPIFATGQTCRYKRKREYYPRNVKKRIKFSK